MSTGEKDDSGGVMASAVLEKFVVPVVLGFADEIVAGLGKRLKGSKADTPAGYELVRKGIGECRTMRGQAKSGHRDGKAPALQACQAWDAELRRVTHDIKLIEQPLIDEKTCADEEKSRKRQAKIDAERKKIAELEAAERERIAAKKDAERAERHAKETAERERIEEEQQAEQARLDVERKELEEAQADVERKNADAEAKLADAQRMERERVRKDLAALEEQEKAERLAEVAKLCEERKPDVQKLRDVGMMLINLEFPKVSSVWAKEILECAKEDLVIMANVIASTLDDFEKDASASE